MFSEKWYLRKPQVATRVGQKSDSLVKLATGLGLMIRAASTRVFVTDPALPVCSFCILPAFKIQISGFYQKNDRFLLISQKKMIKFSE
jgi:hypothetical protein